MTNLPAVNFERYYRHHELTAHLRQAAAAAPERVRLHNLYTTTEGREEWLVEVADFTTTAAKPAYLVHANIHAPEVSGTTAALVLLEQLLTRSDLQDLLREVTFYIIPRLNPDGAEYALVTGGQIRSKFEPRPRKNGLHPEDLNGDGLILQMRWQDPYGPYRLDDEDPRVLVARRQGDEGPFYHTAQEGLVEDYDGGAVHDAQRGFDFNRNWGYNWQPEHLQWGAGDYAFSVPEMKAVADWVYAHPNIFGMLGFHNGPSGVLRPSATVPDADINPHDLRVMKDLGQVGERLTGFTLRAVRDYCGPDHPRLSLKGHFTDWGYFSLGLQVFEIELGSLYSAAGITTDEFFEADEFTRDVTFRRRIYKHADSLRAEDSPAQGFVDWQPFDHPQLGPVEIGGLPIVPCTTPPAPEMASIGPRCADFVIEHARRRPRLEVRDVQVEPLGGEVYRLRAKVGNVGALPTHITQHGRSIQSNGPVTVRLELPEGVELLSRKQVHETAGLEALRGHVELEWFVRGHTGATVTITAQAPKAGSATAEVQLA